MIELKLCPFCGGEASIKVLPEYIGQGVKIPTKYYVDCDVTKGSCACIPSTWHYNTPEEAVESWNRRANDAQE